MGSDIIALRVPHGLATLAAGTPGAIPAGRESRRALLRFLHLDIRNKNTRRAYYKAACLDRGAFLQKASSNRA